MEIFYEIVSRTFENISGSKGYPRISNVNSVRVNNKQVLKNCSILYLGQYDNGVV